MMSANRLILVRHSLPEIVENIPAKEWNLSEEGCRRVPSLVERLKQYQPDVIISSVERKAQQTAEIISQSLGLDIHVVDGLHEHDRSQSPFHLQDDFQNLVENLFKGPDTLVFGNETANQALSRFRWAVESVLNSYGEQTILIVAHGTVISLYVSHLTGIDGYRLWQDLGLPSCIVLGIRSSSLIKMINIP